MSTSLRSSFRSFFRRIHPDLLPAVAEAKQTNTTALQELNHLLDRLASPEIDENPSVGQTLPLFVLKTNGRLRPTHLVLPPIPPSADFLEKRQIASALVHKISALLVDPGVGRSPPLAGRVAPLLANSQSTWKFLVESEISREQTNQLLYQPPPTKEEIHRKFLRLKLSHKLTLKYNKIKNKLTRKIKFTQLNFVIDKIINSTLNRPNTHEALSSARVANGALPPSMPSPSIANIDNTKQYINKINNKTQDTTSARTCNEQNINKIARLGYNPNYVFFSPSLEAAQVRLGLASLAGEGLREEADIWLLENIFQALRNSQPPVPVILSEKFDASSKFGFMEIPVNFRLEELARFVDDHVDDVRQVRKIALDKIR